MIPPQLKKNQGWARPKLQSCFVITPETINITQFAQLECQKYAGLNNQLAVLHIDGLT